MPDEPLIDSVRAAIERAALGVEMLGAVVIVAGALRAAVTRGTLPLPMKLDEPGASDSHQHPIGRSLLLGPQLLVAGDGVRIVALAPTLTHVAVPGLLVPVRSLLGWTLTVKLGGAGRDRRARRHRPGKPSGRQSLPWPHADPPGARVARRNLSPLC
jgi:uncharacterized membrane protein